MRAGGLIVAADEKGFCGCGNPVTHVYTMHNIYCILRNNIMVF